MTSKVMGVGVGGNERLPSPVPKAPQAPNDVRNFLGALKALGKILENLISEMFHCR